MGRPTSSSKRMRNLVGILKDQVSLIRATLHLSKTTNTFKIAILRATAHFPADPPQATTLDEVLAVGHHHRPAASAVVECLIRRLRRTHNTYVALKCLLTLHHIISRGSPVLKDQISSSLGPHNNLLNLSNFRDQTDAVTWELSAWVRWYAGVLEQGLFHLSPLTVGQSYQHLEERKSSANLLKEIGLLVGMVEQICNAPESLHYQRISLVYEVVKMVGEDYRMILRQILVKIDELGRRIEDMSDEELGEFHDDLQKLEDCKEKAAMMFINKKMNDGGWDSIAEKRLEVQAVKQRRESMRMVRVETRLGEIQIRPLKPRGKRWLDVAWNRNPLVLSPAC